MTEDNWSNKKTCKACEVMANLRIPPKIMNSIASFINVRKGITTNDKRMFKQKFYDHVKNIFYGSSVRHIMSNIKNCALCIKIKNYKRRLHNYNIKKNKPQDPKKTGPMYYSSMFKKYKNTDFDMEYLKSLAKARKAAREKGKGQKRGRKKDPNKPGKSRKKKKPDKEEAKEGAKEDDDKDATVINEPLDEKIENKQSGMLEDDLKDAKAGVQEFENIPPQEPPKNQDPQENQENQDNNNNEAK